MVSTAPPGSSWTNGGSGVWVLVLFVTLSPGDQVMLEPRSSEAGEMVSAGSSC
jgi:hypothetical protein